MNGMPYRQHTFNNADEVQAAAAAALEESLDKGEVPVLLVPTSAAVMRMRRAFADSRCAFGARIETPASWIADQWELFGDGRRIVERGERELLMQRACDESAALPSTPGTVALLARLAREDLPPVLRARSDEGMHLTAAECAACKVLDHYDNLLGSIGLCEVSQAAWELACVWEGSSLIVLAGFDNLDCSLEHLFEQLSSRVTVLRFDDGCTSPYAHPERALEIQQVLERLFRPAADEPLAATGAVRFLLPAGRYAVPTLVLRCALEAVESACARSNKEGTPVLPVVVASRNPRAMFNQVADGMTLKGVEAAVSARLTFADTAFGRAFLALLAFFYDEPCCVSKATDFALSPFSGLSSRTACDLDATWRADRLVNRTSMVVGLSEESETAAEVFAALVKGDVDGALAVFEQRIRRRTDLDADFRAEQLASVSCAREFMKSCVQAGVAPLTARPLLERTAVSTNVRTCPENNPVGSAPAVLFMSLSDVAERPACSCSTLILCDLEATSYPVKASEDGRTLLMEKLGLCQPADPLAEARNQFFRALSTARDCVVCERVLNTENADESYPAVMYEELLDCYRAAEALAPATDRVTGLPKCLAPFSVVAGEDTLQENLAPTADPSRAPVCWEVPPSGVVSEALRPRIILPQPHTPEGAAPVLSPSAIETYLECPYKWFALRRLRTSELDAEFGPKEMGSFSHAVLKDFYERFRGTGALKVNATNLSVARDVLDVVFAERLAAQPLLKPKDNPLIARTKFEEADIDDLRRKLFDFLDREAQLLPGFVPTFFELPFGTEKPFEYAGCLLHGSIDRVDVNDRGQAVVIDYKGSVGKDYDVSDASPAAQAGGAVVPHKVQTLVYAQVVRRLLGLDVVGALYVSYAKPRVAGAVDRTVLGEAEVPGLSVEACGVPGFTVEDLAPESFSDLVDVVETRIELAAKGLLAGHIAPDPRGVDPCGYCPVLTCEHRREKR